MKTFKDFIVSRFGINEDASFQEVVSNPDGENIDYNLNDIFKYMFQNYPNDTLKLIESFINEHKDNVLQNKWENFTNTFKAINDDRLVDKPLGNLKGSLEQNPDLRPNEQANF